MEKIDSRVLDSPAAGYNLRGISLRAELGSEPTLLVFLRHFGRIFCRQAVALLRALCESDPGYPAVVFFHMGTAEEGALFFGKRWPRARAVADPGRMFFQSFGLKRGGWPQVIGWKVWIPAIRALGRGHSIGKPTGDIWQMPGAVLVQGDRIIWRHDYRHSGDHPDFRLAPGSPAAPPQRRG